MRAPRELWAAWAARRAPGEPAGRRASRKLAGRRASGEPAGRRAAQEPTARYGLLLLLLILTYLLSASGRLSTLVAELQTVLFFGVLLLALRTGQASRRTATVIGLVALLGSVVAVIVASGHTRGGDGAADIWKGLILLLTAVLIVRRVLARPTVTVQSIYGAISAYMILGLMYAAFYAAIERLGGGPFFAHHQPANTQTFQYFSFTTLTTLGYGDFTAVGNSGRALAVVEALTGQVFLATLVARLVAAFRSPTEQARTEDAAEARPARRRPPGYAAHGSRMSYHRKPPAGRGRPAPGPPSPGSPGPSGRPDPPGRPGSPSPPRSAGDP
jgi:hypothetical protein